MTFYKMRTTPIKQWEGGAVRSVAILGFVASIVGAFLCGQFFSAMFEAGGGEAAVYFVLGFCAMIGAGAGFLVALVLPIAWLVN